MISCQKVSSNKLDKFVETFPLREQQAKSVLRVLFALHGLSTEAIKAPLRDFLNSTLGRHEMNFDARLELWNVLTLSNREGHG